MRAPQEEEVAHRVRVGDGVACEPRFMIHPVSPWSRSSGAANDNV